MARDNILYNLYSLNVHYFFRWIDKLGTTARLGVDLVIRQSIFAQGYSLIDKNFDPLPVSAVANTTFDSLITLRILKCLFIHNLKQHFKIQHSTNIICKTPSITYNILPKIIRCFFVGFLADTSLQTYCRTSSIKSSSTRM